MAGSYIGIRKQRTANRQKEDKTVEDIINTAISAYRSGEYTKAIDLFSQTVDLDRQNWLAWYYLGLSYIKSGKTDHGYRVMSVVGALCPIKNLRELAASVINFQNEDLEPEDVRQAS